MAEIHLERAPRRSNMYKGAKTWGVVKSSGDLAYGALVFGATTDFGVELTAENGARHESHAFSGS